jgi:quinol monooxygenase YgiN
MTFVVIAEYRAASADVPRIRAALQAMIEPTRQEPANRCYEVLVDPNAPDRFTLYEEYTDEAGFQAHTETQHFERWVRGDVLPHLTERRIHKLVPLGQASITTEEGNACPS